MKIGVSTALSAAVVLLAVSATPTFATAVRTFVSGKGSDANACSLVAPCRTFAGALAQTSSGGEIVVLDSAGFGAVTINKPVTISNQTGVEGGIFVNSGEAVIVNLSAFGSVTLRGLTIDGGSTALHGIDFSTTSAGELNIVGCTIRNFAQVGIRVTYNASTANALLRMVVRDTMVTQTLVGLALVNNSSGSGAALHAGVFQSTMVHGGDGIDVGGTGLVDLMAENDDLRDNILHGVDIAGAVGDNVELRHSVAELNGAYDLEVTTAANVFLIDHSLVASINNPIPSTVYADGTNILGTMLRTTTPYALK